MPLPLTDEKLILALGGEVTEWETCTSGPGCCDLRTYPTVLKEEAVMGMFLLQSVSRTREGMKERQSGLVLTFGKWTLGIEIPCRVSVSWAVKAT